MAPEESGEDPGGAGALLDQEGARDERTETGCGGHLNMAKQTALEDVKELMADLVEARTAQLEEVQRGIEETRQKLKEVDAAIASATVSTDLQAYEKGTAAKSKLETALSMYTTRLELIRDGEYISEAESDAVVDRLLAYEEQITDRFRADIAGPIETLKNIYNAYAAEFFDIEATLSTWQREIHATITAGAGRFIMTRTALRPTGPKSHSLYIYGIIHSVMRQSACATT